MPKAPNLENPIAAIRHRLGMKIDAFSEFVGHGAPMLKHVEAGRKRVSTDLAAKISGKTGVPLPLLMKPRISKKEQQLIANLAFNDGWSPAQSPEILGKVIGLLPTLIATVLLLHKQCRVGSGAVSAALGCELGRLVVRFGIDVDELSNLAHAIDTMINEGDDSPTAKMMLTIYESQAFRSLFTGAK